MTEKNNIIQIIFNGNERKKDEEDLRAMELIEEYIESFRKNPPDTQFQLGYLFALVDLMRDLDGPDYGEMAISFARDVAK